MGEVVECEELTHEKFIIAEQWERFGKEGGIIHACGTYLKSREIENNTTYPISTKNDCFEMVLRAVKIITFRL